MNIRGNALAAINRLGSEAMVERVVWRTLTRANRNLQTLYRKHARQAIRETTERRTGNLLKVKTRAHRNRAEASLLINPNFPDTAYATPAGRGRAGASKRGQYAFVVNNRRHFLRIAQQRMGADPEVAAILSKHLAFILDQILKGR